MTEDVLTLLRDQAALLFERHCTKSVVDSAETGAWPAELWAAIEEAGLLDVLVPEDRGGTGAGLPEAVAILRVAAAAAAPVPLAETMLCRFLLGEAAKGKVGIGFIGQTSGIGRSPLSDLSSGVEIAWAAVADACVLAEEATGRLHRVARDGIRVLRARRNLAGEPRETVIATSLKTAGVAPSGASPLALLALLRAAQMSGALTRVLAIAVEYGKERVQFGRAIASFQAIQQMLAAAAGHVAATSVAVDIAAASPSDVTCAAAKIRAGEAAGYVWAIAHQIVGALGYTREYKLHPLTRRLWSWRDEAGDEAFWQDHLATHAFANGAADDLWAYVTSQTGG